MTISPHPDITSPVPACPGTDLSLPTERRALLRQYKDSRPAAGVFSLTNEVNGKVYIGGSLNVEGLMNRLRFELKMRSHPNKLLQRDWTAHGPQAFSFAVLDQIKERPDPLFDYQAELDTLLALWREEIPCHGEQGYNGRNPPNAHAGGAA